MRNQGRVEKEGLKDGAKESKINFQNKATHNYILNIRFVFGYGKNNFCSISNHRQ